MKNNNKIDELFREELSSYSIPLTFSTLPIITAAVKKNLFYKFSFLKFNIYYATILATGSVGGISYGAIKMYENSHQQEKKQVIKTQNNTYKTTNDSAFIFKKEIHTISASEKIKLRKLYQEIEIMCKPGEEFLHSNSLLDKLKGLLIKNEA